jgi:hypothetical protein
MKTLLTEGRYDSIVTRLSRTLFDVVKASYSAVSDPDGKFAGKKIYYDPTAGETIPDINATSPAGQEEPQPAIYFEEVENQSIPLDFYLQLKVQWIKDFNDFRKGGDAFNDTRPDSDQVPLIEIRLEIDASEYPDILSTVAMQIRDTLRHEIEHLTQSGWNVKPGKYIKSDQSMRRKIESGDLPPYRYFILPKEVDANIQGLYYQAKKQKTPLRNVMNDYLDLFVPDVITVKEKEMVLNVWRSRLPALAIRQEI